jgi:CRISPR system Cascade subunit CasA
MRFMPGVGFEELPTHSDPMQPYSISEKNGKLPVRFKESRGTWRDFDSLLPDNSGLAPLTIENALRLGGKADQMMPESILALGLRYEPPNANADFWRIERFTLPAAIRGNRFIREDIRQLLADAEEAGRSLRAACSEFARDSLSRGDRKPMADDVRRFIKQIPSIEWYWSTLGLRFHKTLRDYTLERDFEDVRHDWLRLVRETLGEAWRLHSDSISTADAWAIRALVRAEWPLLRKLKALKDELAELEPQRAEEDS